MHLSIILVEQNLRFAKQIGKFFVIMQKGTIVAKETMDELTDQLAH
jgi:ABC-type branched-subunit amino acid transport system ATPase component